MREAVQLLSDLVAIDSVNPTLVDGGAGEAAIAASVARWLERAGLEVQVQEVAPGRPNVTALARGRGGGRTLLLNGHMDTVGVAGMERPHEPRVDGERLYGRGAYDMKSGLVAAMLAAAECARRGLAGDVVLCAVCDEEALSIGSEAAARELRADAAIVTEPTELDVVVAHRGFVWLDVETTGRAAHGSRPDLGVDAIVRMGRVLTGIERLDGELRSGPGHALLGTGSVHASLIKGGQELSTYPERCVVNVERRTVPGESATAAARELKTLLDGVEGSVGVRFVREPMETDPGEPIVRALDASCRRLLGRQPELVGAPFWTDAALFAAAGIPSILFGPGGEGAHAAVEWADLRQLEQAVDVLVAVAADFCA